MENMRGRMLLLLVLLVQWRVTACTSSPTLEDNMLPTDEEVLLDLINSYRGQPEQEIALNLPTDEEALNEIKPILQSGNPFYYTDGTGRFIPSSFPEIDSRGFHESVFDNLDDLYSVSHRGRRFDSSVMVDGGSVNDGFAFLMHPNKGFYESDENAEPSFSSYHPRGKRAIRAKPLLKFKKKNKILPVLITHRLHGHSNSKKTVNSTGLQESNITRCNDTKSETISETRQKREAPQWTMSRLHEKRKPEMTGNGFHGDVFDSLKELERLRKRKSEMDSSSLSNFGDNDANDDFKLNVLGSGPYFNVIDKRVPEIDKGGFHGDVFHNNFGNFHTLKRAPDMGQSGFHNDIFHKSFGDFNTLKRAPEMSQIGFHNDVFHNSFGNFETLRKRKPAVDTKNFNNDAFNRDFGNFDTLRKRKRKPTGNPATDNFSSDMGIFERDFGNFYTGKRRPNAGAVNGDAFHSNFGIFETLKKRRPQADLIGDAFHRSFGNFDTMKRTLGGDAFHSQFGKFETMKRRPGADTNDFDNDLFHDQFGKFDTLKKSTTASSEPLSERELNNYIEVFDKVKPLHIGKLQYVINVQPQDEVSYEQLRTFFRNHALLNKLNDMTKRLERNETHSPTSLNFLKNNSSFIH